MTGPVYHGFTGPVYHGWTHRPKLLGGSDPNTPVGHFEIKVFADDGALDGNLPATATTVSTGNGKFIFEIPEDLAQTTLVQCRAYVTTVSSSGAVTVMLRNVTQAVDMLTTAITIDAGELSSRTAATPPAISSTNADVADGDQIAIDVDGAGTGAMGLGVILMFALV